MASKRAANEYVADESYEAADDEPREDSFHSSPSDSEDFDVADYFRLKAEHDAVAEKAAVKLTKQEKAYKQRIATQLADSGEALEGKLNWCSVVLPPPVKKIVVVHQVTTQPEPEEVRKEKSKRFGKSKPMPIDIKVCGSTNLRFVSPPREVRPPSVARPQGNSRGVQPPSGQPSVQPSGQPSGRAATEKPRQRASVCRFIFANEPCPFGETCRFSHVPKRRDAEPKPPRDALTAEGKTKKIWMCKNVPDCSFGSKCIYAHTEQEVQAAVSKCPDGANCKRVKKIDGIYINVATARKCNRLHPREHIRNFIERTK